MSLLYRLRVLWDVSRLPPLPIPTSTTGELSSVSVGVVVRPTLNYKFVFPSSRESYGGA